MSLVRSALTAVRTSATVLASGALAVALVGCSSGLITPGAPPQATDSEAPAPDDKSAEEIPASTCLLGSWVMPGAQMQSYYNQLSVDSSADLTVSGEVHVHFTSEGTYEYTPDFTLLLEIMSMEAFGDLTGSIRGEYASDDGTITTKHNANDVSMQMLINGKPMDGTAAFETMLAALPISDAPYECSGDTATIMFATGEGSPRTPVEFSRVD